MSEVYLLKNNFEHNLKKIYPKLSKKFISDKIAIKVHFGEEGCTTYLEPALVKILTKEIKHPYLIESNVLYKGKRNYEKDHLQLAKEHGFTFCPIIIADGEKGDDYFEIEINKNHFNKVKVGKGLKEFENLIVFSHFTGHVATGFGGALKNLGMGLASRAGKLAMHCKTKITIDKEKCIACGICIENCPAGAITYVEGKAYINPAKCIKCAKCIAVCSQKAPSIPWTSVRGKDIQERIVEYCFGINNYLNIIYFTSLNNVTLDCDCSSEKQVPVIGDIGILASSDPVAIDQAALDLVKEKAGKDIFKEDNNIDSSLQLEYGERLGLGTRNYELIRL